MIGMLRHKVAAYTLSAAFCMLAFDGLHAQAPAVTHRVQAVIPDLRSARQAHDVDLALRAFPGVRMSRTDFNTRNLLIEVSADCAITRDQIAALLLPFELSLTCYSRNALHGQAYIPLDPRNCAEPLILR
jgi:hypothetical protein